MCMYMPCSTIAAAHRSEQSWQQRLMSSMSMLKTNCKQATYSPIGLHHSGLQLEKWTGTTHTTDLPTQHIVQHRCSLQFTGPHEGWDQYVYTIERKHLITMVTYIPYK